jgi:hypothetical protein
LTASTVTGGSRSADATRRRSLTVEELRAAWSPVLQDGPPWCGWSAELVLANSNADLVLGGVDDDSWATELWLAEGRLLRFDVTEDNVIVSEHSVEELPELEAALRESTTDLGDEVWTDVADRPF